MKITIKNEFKEVTIETDSVCTVDAVEVVIDALVAMGHARDNVIDAMYEISSDEVRMDYE